MQVTHTFMIISVVIIVVMIAVEETIRLHQIERRNATLKWYYVHFWFKNSESDSIRDADLHSMYMSGRSVKECIHKVHHILGKRAIVVRIVKIKEVKL
jgi:hypothetical protein